jgi:hypothetical protein
LAIRFVETQAIFAVGAGQADAISPLLFKAEKLFFRQHRRVCHISLLVGKSDWIKKYPAYWRDIRV